MTGEKGSGATESISRRGFLLSSAATGAGIALAGAGLAESAFGQEAASPKAPGDLNVGIIGVGEQGRVLIESCLRIPGIRFKALCDVWEYSRVRAARYLKKSGHVVGKYETYGYEDYREMLEKERDLDAVIVATPDWMHAEHANACMEAGMHVYCEKEMSNSLEKAKSIVDTARKTGRLVQIGHQRRSNPRYLHAIDNLIRRERLLGRVTHAYAQWNRAKSEDLGWPKQYPIDSATLAKYGYDSMSEFRNWRWYRKYGGGPIVDLGSHQIDVFSWVFGTNPKSIIASGGVDYYKQHEWYDNVMAIYEFENEQGVGRAFYQVLTTSSHAGFLETFMGDEGSIEISEVPQRGNSALREQEADENKWDELARRGWLEKVSAPIQSLDTKNVVLDVRVTVPLGQWPLPVELAKPAHQPHLENFFDAIRLGKPLNCPAELGYETAVMVLKANDAVAAGTRLEFKPEDFRA
jgi:predicted dehydrogenase